MGSCARDRDGAWRQVIERYYRSGAFSSVKFFHVE